MPSSPPFTPGVQLTGRYELVRRLAPGAFGDVWLATDPMLDRQVAIKLLRAESGKPGALLTFRDQAREAGSLLHENIVKIYDFNEVSPDGAPFLVMEFIDGEPLDEALAAGPMEPDRAMDVLAQAAAGLAAAHQAGVVHGDLKPRNVLLTPDGLVKLTDVGIGQAAQAGKPANGASNAPPSTGTSPYLAPEVAGGADPTPASDLYSLGVLAYLCLTGSAHIGRTSGLPRVAQESLSELQQSVPADVAALLGRLAAEDPADRPHHAADVARQAAELRDSLLSAQPDLPEWPELLPVAATDGEPSTSPIPAWPRRRIRRVPIAAAVVALAGVAILTNAHLRAGDSHPPTAASARIVKVAVDSAFLRGRPISRVRAILLKRGLRVRVHWRPSHRVAPGRVISVRPDGRVPVGSVVIITGALAPTTRANSSGTGPHQGRGHGRDHALNPSHRSSPPASPISSPSPTSSPTPTSSPSPTSSPAPTPSISLTLPAGPAALLVLRKPSPPTERDRLSAHPPGLTQPAPQLWPRRCMPCPDSALV